jgi:hypothetical protein
MTTNNDKYGPVDPLTYLVLCYQPDRDVYVLRDRGDEDGNMRDNVAISFEELERYLYWDEAVRVAALARRSPWEWVFVRFDEPTDLFPLLSR